MPDAPLSFWPILSGVSRQLPKTAAALSSSIHCPYRSLILLRNSMIRNLLNSLRAATACLSLNHSMKIFLKPAAAAGNPSLCLIPCISPLLPNLRKAHSMSRSSLKAARKCTASTPGMNWTACGIPCVRQATAANLLSSSLLKAMTPTCTQSPHIPILRDR